jgi:hypothetical protein
MGAHVYDMYPWDIKDSATKDSQNAATQERATQAVQVALDRRDNGGDVDQ